MRLWDCLTANLQLCDYDWELKTEIETQTAVRQRDWERDNATGNWEWIWHCGKCEAERQADNERRNLRDWNCENERMWDWGTETWRLKFRDWNWDTLELGPRPRLKDLETVRVRDWETETAFIWNYQTETKRVKLRLRLKNCDGMIKTETETETETETDWDWERLSARDWKLRLTFLRTEKWDWD